MELIVTNRARKTIGFKCVMQPDAVLLFIDEPYEEEVRMGNIAPGGDWRFSGLKVDHQEK